MASSQLSGNNLALGAVKALSLTPLPRSSPAGVRGGKWQNKGGLQGPWPDLSRCMAAEDRWMRSQECLGGSQFPSRQHFPLLPQWPLQPKSPHTSSILCHVKGHRMSGVSLAWLQRPAGRMECVLRPAAVSDNPRAGWAPPSGPQQSWETEKRLTCSAPSGLLADGPAGNAGGTGGVGHWATVLTRCRRRPGSG